MFTIEAGVLDKAQLIIDFLKQTAAKEMSKYNRFRLIYPMGFIQNIDLQKSFFEL